MHFKDEEGVSVKILQRKIDWHTFKDHLVGGSRSAAQVIRAKLRCLISNMMRLFNFLLHVLQHVPDNGIAPSTRVAEIAVL